MVAVALENLPTFFLVLSVSQGLDENSDCVRQPADQEACNEHHHCSSDSHLFGKLLLLRVVTFEKYNSSAPLDGEKISDEGT